ncbi:MAG: tetratricopeptide repeat protein [Bacteroidota bacterium]|nr:tetratricopeptide repeat protein [Bacteroidota bacterium]
MSYNQKNKNISKKQNTKPGSVNHAFKPSIPSKVNNKNTIYLAIAVLILTFISYVPCLSFDFTNLDDQYYIINNPDIKGFSFKNLKLIFTNYYVGHYQPIAMLTYALDFKLMGLNPFIYHFTSFLFHLVNTLLVFIFFKKLSSNNYVATIVAVLFGIHTLHIESVAWVSERKDVSYAFFYILALITYLDYKKKKSIKLYLITIFIFILSCMSKAMAVSFSVTIIAIDYLLDKRINLKSLKDKIPFLVISLIFGILAIYSQRSEGAGLFIKNVSGVYTPFDRFLMANYSFFFYIEKLIYPFNLSVLHPYPYKINNTLPAIYKLAPVLNVILIGLVIWSLKLGKKVMFGFMFFFFNIAQMLQIISIGSVIASERYTYISALGLFFIVGEGVREVIENPKYKKYKVMVVALSLATVFSLSFLSYKHIFVWKNSENLWTEMIKTYPKNELPFFNRAVYYFDKKQTDLAFKDFCTAIENNPNYVEAISARADIYLQRHDNNSALKDLSKLIQIKQNDYNSYLRRGNVYREMGQNKLAKDDFMVIVKNVPGNYSGYMNLAIQNCIEGNTNEAINNFNKAQELSPNSPEIYSNRANMYAMLKDYDKAIHDYNKALQINPNISNSYLNRGLLKLEFKKFDEALIDFKKVIDIEPNNAAAYIKISMIYKEKGDKNEALNYAMKAKALGIVIEDSYLTNLR